MNELAALFQRLDWLSVLDIGLVALIFFVVLYLMRGTQAEPLLRGLVMTIQVSVLALLLGTVIGIALGIVRIIGPRPIQRLIIGYVTLIRGTPAIFHIYAASLLLPKLGIELSVFWVGLIALTFNTVWNPLILANGKRPPPSG